MKKKFEKLSKTFGNNQSDVIYALEQQLLSKEQIKQFAEQQFKNNSEGVIIRNDSKIIKIKKEETHVNHYERALGFVRPRAVRRFDELIGQRRGRPTAPVHGHQVGLALARDLQRAKKRPFRLADPHVGTRAAPHQL